MARDYDVAYRAFNAFVLSTWDGDMPVEVIGDVLSDAELESANFFLRVCTRYQNGIPMPGDDPDWDKYLADGQPGAVALQKAVSAQDDPIDLPKPKAAFFTADWILPDAMDEIGYERIINEHSPEPEYYKYGNKAGTVSPYYGPMGKHKRLIYFNCGYVEGKLFVGIMEDAGTRRVYNGIISERAHLLFLLDSVI